MVHHDLRCAFRLLRKSPGFAAVAILLLATGIAANTAVFSLVNALFWKPLPSPQPQQLARVTVRDKNGLAGGEFSFPDYLVLRGHAGSFASLAAVYAYAPLNVAAGGESREEQGAVVTANYFALLGVQPIRGRLFRPEEDEAPDRDPVAVISARLWKSRFGGDESAVGRDIKINGVVFRIIGILPQEFYGDQPGVSDELWIPSMMLHVGYRWCDAISSPGCAPLRLLGRLKPGRTIADAAAELGAIRAPELAALNPGDRLAVLPATGADPEEKQILAPQMQVLLAIAAMLLLISCANLAGLLLARSVTRRKEIVVRLAIGASRARIVRQLLTENFLLALLGGGVGVSFALWLRGLLVGFISLQSEGGQRAYDVGLDGRVLLFSAALAAVTGVFFGVLPAWRAAQCDMTGELKLGAGSLGSQRTGRMRDVLAAGQVALSVALLVAAGLLVRSSQNVLARSNFDADHVAVLRVRPRLVHYTAPQAEQFYRSMAERLSALPDAESFVLGLGGHGLLWGRDAGVTMKLALPGSPERSVRVLPVTPGFVATLRIPLLRGRAFRDSDGAGSPRVVMLNQAAARSFWPGESPLGRFVDLNGVPYEVVGVLADLLSPHGPPSPQIYSDFWQSNPGPEGDVRLAVRTAGDPAVALPEIRRAIANADPQVPIGEDMPLRDQVRASYASLWLARAVGLGCGALALILSALGLYSVLAFTVRSRMREIGVRMALGARPPDVMRLVVFRGLAVSLSGTMLGLALAAAASRVLASWLYGVGARDIATYLISAAVLVAAALLASYLPARSAANVDPMVVLRSE